MCSRGLAITCTTCSHFRVFVFCQVLIHYRQGMHNLLMQASDMTPCGGSFVQWMCIGATVGLPPRLAVTFGVQG